MSANDAALAEFRAWCVQEDKERMGDKLRRIAAKIESVADTSEQAAHRIRQFIEEEDL
jgi:uncharacterized protein Yka (UPF0111/DUF47 family)